MKNYNQPFAYVLMIICSTFILFPGISYSAPAKEQKKIDYLLNAVGNSDSVFIRNGKEYSGKEAKEHLQTKLSKAGDHIKTADDFIRLIASKSYTSGKPYYVKTADGKQMKSETWFRRQLKKYK